MILNRGSHMRQQSFDLKTWGGKRKGAGRKPAAGLEGIRHDARDAVRPWHPVHVTMRMAEHVWNLRSERSFRIIDAALCAVRARRDFRVVHFSLQGNHVHLIVEAAGTRALANGMRALSIRLSAPRRASEARTWLLRTSSAHWSRAGRRVEDPGGARPLNQRQRHCDPTATSAKSR
jgi:REP element-mobilizing transposase RayT